MKISLAILLVVATVALGASLESPKTTPDIKARIAVLMTKIKPVDPAYARLHQWALLNYAKDMDQVLQNIKNLDPLYLDDVGSRISIDFTHLRILKSLPAYGCSWQDIQDHDSMLTALGMGDLRDSAELLAHVDEWESYGLKLDWFQAFLVKLNARRASRCAANYFQEYTNKVGRLDSATLTFVDNLYESSVKKCNQDKEISSITDDDYFTCPSSGVSVDEIKKLLNIQGEATSNEKTNMVARGRCKLFISVVEDIFKRADYDNVASNEVYKDQNLLEAMQKFRTCQGFLKLDDSRTVEIVMEAGKSSYRSMMGW